MTLLVLIPHHVSKTGAVFSAWTVEGEHVVDSRQPFYDSARVLLERGHSPTEILEARHCKSDIVCMRGTMGDAAKWTVIEEAKRGLRRIPWRPMPESLYKK